jgi:hypothetical protein
VDNGDEPHEVKEHTVSNLLTQSQQSKDLLGTHMHLYQVQACIECLPLSVPTFGSFEEHYLLKLHVLKPC